MSWGLGVLAAANLLAGFALQWLVLVSFGASGAADAVFASLIVPQAVVMVVTGALSKVLVPILATADASRFERDAWTLFQGLAAVFGVVAGLLAVTAPGWIGWVVPGFDAPARALTVSLTRIQILGMVMSVAASVQWSALQARGRFVWAEAAPLVSGLAALAFLAWGLPRWGVTAAAWAMTLRAGGQVLLMLPSLGGYRAPDASSPCLKQAWTRLKPILAGASFYKLSYVADRFLASLSSAGSLALYHLAQQLYGAVEQVVNKALTAPMLPRLAREQDAGSFKRLYRRNVGQVFAVVAACYGGLLLFGGPALRLVFQRGSMTGADVQTLWWLMAALGGQILLSPVLLVMGNAFYAKGNTTVPTLIGAYGVPMALLLKGIGFSILGVVGIAVGTSVYYALLLAIYLVFYTAQTAVWRTAEST